MNACRAETPKYLARSATEKRSYESVLAARDAARDASDPCKEVKEEDVSEVVKVEVVRRRRK